LPPVLGVREPHQSPHEKRGLQKTLVCTGGLHENTSKSKPTKGWHRKPGTCVRTCPHNPGQATPLTARRLPLTVIHVTLQGGGRETKKKSSPGGRSGINHPKRLAHGADLEEHQKKKSSAGKQSRIRVTKCPTNATVENDRFAVHKRRSTGRRRKGRGQARNQEKRLIERGGSQRGQRKPNMAGLPKIILPVGPNVTKLLGKKKLRMALHLLRTTKRSPGCKLGAAETFASAKKKTNEHRGPHTPPKGSWKNSVTNYFRGAKVVGMKGATGGGNTLQQGVRSTRQPLLSTQSSRRVYREKNPPGPGRIVGLNTQRKKGDPPPTARQTICKNGYTWEREGKSGGSEKRVVGRGETDQRNFKTRGTRPKATPSDPIIRGRKMLNTGGGIKTTTNEEKKNRTRKPKYGKQPATKPGKSNS